MTFNRNPQPVNLPLGLGRLFGQDLKAVALLCGEILDDDVTTVMAYLSHDEYSPKFRHALEMERAYCHALLRFDDIAPPDYGNFNAIDLARMATELGVAQVYCVVILGIDDTANGYRDYEGVEMTILDAVTEQLARLQNRLARRIEMAISNPVLQ